MTAAASAVLPLPQAGAEPTLDELLVRAWEDLCDGLSIACAVCEGVMEPERAHSAVVGGRCHGCGTTLW